MTLKRAASAQQTLDLYYNFWRRAFSQELRLPFASKAAANSFRMRLYLAVRPFRDHPKDWDEKAWKKAKDGEKQRYEEYVELHRIIGQLEAVAQELPDGSGMLILRRVENNPELARLAALAGIPWGFEAEAQESQKRIMEGLKDLPGIEAIDYMSDAYKESLAAYGDDDE